MKKNIFYFIAFYAICSKAMLAQTSVTQVPNNATNVPSAACLSCPGGIWSNELNVSAADGISASTDLTQNGFCFQSSCFTSRQLTCNQFGFSIPGTASILGIEVSILRNAPSINSVKDSVVRILKNGVTMSSNYRSAVFWPTIYMTEVYGGPTNLWGLTWTPADINDPTTEIDLQILNTTAAMVAGINVDQVKMTVYYLTATGVVESQTAIPNSLFIDQSETGNILCSFVAAKNDSPDELTLFDLSGRVVFTKKLGTLTAGDHQERLPIGDLQSGIYFIQYADGEKRISKKFSVSR